MFSKRSLEGYLLIDHRCPGGGVFESATVTCCHCSTIVVLNPDRLRPRNHCRKCDAYVCDKPECSFACVPMAKVLDQAQELAGRGVILTNDIVDALMRGEPPSAPLIP